MITVRKIAVDIVAREGGYVNDPDDPGGATNFGVTIHTMRRLGLDLTGDGRVNEADVKALTRDHAVDIFIEHYFRQPRLHMLPESLQASVFDMYVNAGSNAVKILQAMLVDLGHDLAVDGQMGPLTAKAAHQAVANSDGETSIPDLYAMARRDYYYDLADRRPASRKYARRRDGGKGGWITRAEEFLSPVLRYTDAQHRARTGGWS